MPSSGRAESGPPQLFSGYNATIRRSSPLMAFHPGSKLGPNVMVAPAGAGGMAEVCRARDTRLFVLHATAGGVR
jgi:hypothetical protein